jgi:hypothetical protein
MRGKYSPTVSAAYMQDQGWWDKYSGATKPGAEYIGYDPDGYDSYGYDENDVDRAGNYEYDYYHNDGDYDLDEDYNIAYDQALRDWGFDGVRPVLRK